MSLAEVLAELPSFSLRERQQLIRSAIELDESDLAPADLQLVEARLSEHRAAPESAVSLGDMKKRLQTRLGS